MFAIPLLLVGAGLFFWAKRKREVKSLPGVYSIVSGSLYDETLSDNYIKNVLKGMGLRASSIIRPNATSWLSYDVAHDPTIANVEFADGFTLPQIIMVANASDPKVKTVKMSVTRAE